ncbi:Gpi16 subunit, GPI transamidase component [Piromyces finnis]|uniref:Gpi16 subunit, GPI transamidase component n=1 Tax=Piromyces finnis TaxID=1754191 RepID=A0A1Y1VCH4_9FUNG|nr:Gpi16 subunit, GPI transamidase component [Piromyces finnis]|eukprot:ORX51849.1 Gpi16 subunit, GPI transamidase component [Piromyces finnis]
MFKKKIISISSFIFAYFTIFSIINVVYGENVYSDSFSEELTMKNLSETEILAVFNFTQTMDLKEDNKITSYYQLFPRAIGQIVEKYHVKEFHITFTRGSWNSYQWGLNTLPVPVGVEFYAYFDANYDTNENWSGLANAISGVFCASVNYIDRSKSAKPNYSFKPSGSYNEEEKIEMRYGSLSHEGVCTENLTPWIKLLPCQSKMGIAGLLNNYKLFDTNYYSMMAHLIPVCIDSECKHKQLQLTQIISTVFDNKRISKNGNKSWSTESLFGKKISSYCPVSTNSKIKIELNDSDGENNYRLIQSPSRFESSTKDTKYAVYDLISKRYDNLNIGVNIINEKNIQPIQKNIGLEVYRSQSGFAEEYGGFVVTMKNNNIDKDLSITYFDIIPWFVNIYFNSFKIQNTKVKDYQNDQYVNEFYYEPAIEHVNPTILEMKMIIPRDSTTTIEFDFDKKHLLYADYPPDCARGFDVGSAVVTVHNITLGEGYLYPTEDFIRIYTEPIVIILPAPDFSMPYNVITYSCTIIALFFGSMYNAYTRRYIPLVVEKEEKEKGKNETQKIPPPKDSISATEKEEKDKDK